MAHTENPIAPPLSTLAASNESVVVLPAPQPRRTMPPLRRSPAFDFLATTLVLLFAFLAASYVVRNSDFWLHLATGRLVANGQYQFGHDPFAYTTGEIVWVNHSWLFDYLLYQVYSVAGGPILVVLKALLVGFLAWVLMQIHRPNDSPETTQGLEWPAFFAALAMLAMSPRMLLQPVLFSSVFLGVSLWLLWRPRTRGTAGHYAPLLALFAFWVNVDSWFLLGPMLVGLFWVGEQCERWWGGDKHRAVAIPWWLFPASLAVCLLNPHHVRAFTVPLELSGVLSTAGLLQDIRLQRSFLSPWQIGIRGQPFSAFNLAEASYFLLVALGLASFVFNRKRWVGWRITVWLGFALLGAWQMRLAPFFVIVAAPITSLNFQDVTAARRQGRAPSRVGLVFARTLVLAGCACLIVLTWPGWLLGFPLDGRRVAWDIQPDESLARVAQTLQDWRRQGILTDTDRGFQLHPDIGHYCAWFSPDVKCYFDGRFNLFPAVAREYEEICRALNPGLEAGIDPTLARTDDWGKLLRDRGFTYVVIYDPDLRRLYPVFDRFVRNDRDWELLQIDGKALTFGLAPHALHNRRAGRLPALNPEQLCFGGPRAAGAKALPPSPGHGPDRLPQPFDLRGCFTRFAMPQTWESDAAVLYLRYVEGTVGRFRQEQEAAGRRGFAAGLAVIAGAAPEPLANVMTIAFRMQNSQLFISGNDEMSPALPLLAIRAARSALAANPDDANAYLILAQAYLGLKFLMQEAQFDDRWPPLAMLRHVQVVTALERALILRPDLTPAHEALSQMYETRQFLDAALEHRRAHFRLVRQAGPLPNEELQQFAKRIQELDNALQDREKHVQDLQNQFTIRAQLAGGSAMRRARLALQLGLVQTALDELAEAQVALLGGEAVQLQVELLLMTGHSDLAAELLNAEEIKANKDKLAVFQMAAMTRDGQQYAYRMPAYEWMLFCQAAADGDFDRAGEIIRQAQLILTTRVEQTLRVEGRGFCLAMTAELGLTADPVPFGMRLFVREERKLSAQMLQEALSLQAAIADLKTIEGLLALEQGNPDSSYRLMQAAIKETAQQTLYESGGTDLAMKYLQRLRAAGTD